MIPQRLFDVSVEGPVTVVKFTEKHLNEANIQQVSTSLSGLADTIGPGELHLDFSEVHYLSSVVMARLLGMHKRITKEGGRFVLKNLDDLYELFRATRLDQLMEVHRDNPPDHLASPEKPS